MPTAQVDRVMRFRQSDVVSAEGRETVLVSGRVVPLSRLDAVLSLPPVAPDDGTITAVLLGGAQQVALRIDAVCGEQEVLVKKLPLPLSRIRNIGAATVLGNGTAVPILNIADLVKSALRNGGGLAQAQAQKMEDVGESRRSRTRVMVAEDSITSRMLLKNILESSGYAVTTAVDGMEALTGLRTGDYDLLVSDVDMPRMNGFELTAGVRQDPRLTDLPVILVTARATREDREHGVDVGANAYIVKGSFDQTNLIETIGRLV